jgi:hypothetical protein
MRWVDIKQLLFFSYSNSANGGWASGQCFRNSPLIFTRAVILQWVLVLNEIEAQQQAEAALPRATAEASPHPKGFAQTSLI